MMFVEGVHGKGGSCALHRCSIVNWSIEGVCRAYNRVFCMQAADYFADDLILEDLCNLLAQVLFNRHPGSSSGTDIPSASQRTGLEQSQQAEQAHVQLDEAATVSGSSLEDQASQVPHCFRLCLDADRKLYSSNVTETHHLESGDSLMYLVPEPIFCLLDSRFFILMITAHKSSAFTADIEHLPAYCFFLGKLCAHEG
jgi:hypothetical protein